MKWLFLLLIGITLLSCETKNVAPVGGSLGVNISGSQNQSILITSLWTPQFTVIVDSISDSRCPAEALCIWAGEASVKFRIQENEFRLKIGESKEFVVNGQNFKITLTDVTPYPSLTNGEEKRKAVFIVKRV